MNRVHLGSRLILFKLTTVAFSIWWAEKERIKGNSVV